MQMMASHEKQTAPPESLLSIDANLPDGFEVERLTGLRLPPSLKLHKILQQTPTLLP